MTPERYARVKELFHQAADLNHHQQDAFLDRECHDDLELKEQVLGLLEHDHSRTIIASSDTTIADIAHELSAPRTKRLSKLAATFRNLTQHLGPRGHLAIGGLISGVVLVMLAYFGRTKLVSFQRELRRAALNEIIDGKVLALEMWIEHEGSKVESWSRSQTIGRLSTQLIELAEQSDDLAHDLSATPIQSDIHDELNHLAGHEVTYSIWDRRQMLIADTLTDHRRIGNSATPWGAAHLAHVFDGETRFIAFDINHTIADYEDANEIEPHMGTLTPLRDANRQIIGAMLIHDYGAREQASRILRMVRLGESGETYVFNSDGVMLSESRFTDQLRKVGLIDDTPDSTAVRSLRLRDPGGDLTSGYKPNAPLDTMPLTEMARQCTAGNDGDNMHGYRDYRGVTVVGAWRWLEDLGVGIATELDINEAEPGLKTLYWQSWLVLALFATCFSVALFSYYSVHRLRQQVGENRKLGQYTLEKQIGEGGMGKVFLARHDLLKQPTAVKLLKPDLIDGASTSRFLREARISSQLKNPNTIRVYDYGSTPEGLFYFVMEFIDGLSLDQLVTLESQIPPSRVIHLLRQICYSLREAHAEGMVHRDIKPSNIMVCPLGGEYDVVKVLDFGLVKSVDADASQQITSSNLVAGTPQYMPPERLSDPNINDPRSDLYSLGAVSYFLLTGQVFIDGKSLADIFVQIVSAPPKRPSEVARQEIPSDLDHLVYQCLAKDPEDRPASAEEIIARIDAIKLDDQWRPSDAKDWWSRRS